MACKNNNLVQSNHRQAAAWAALFAIGCLQLSIAAHQFEHDAGDTEDSCHICIQLDRVNAAVGHAVDDLQLPDFGLSDFETPDLSVGRHTTLGFDSRAPPRF